MTRRLCLLALVAVFPRSAEAFQLIGPLAHEAHLAPGQVAHGEITVRNDSAEPTSVRLYAQDYRFQADGRNDFLEPGALDRSNAAWVEFAPHEMVLPPGASAAFAWAMSLPKEPVEPGTWWSVIMVEPGTDPAEGTPSGDVQVRTVFRYAVQMVTHVGSEVPASLAFTGQRLASGEHGTELQVDVANPSDRLLVPSLSANVHAEDGAAVNTFVGGQARIYPGCSARFHIPLAALPPGRYPTLIVADAGEDALFGAQAVLDLGASSEPPRTAEAH